MPDIDTLVLVTLALFVSGAAKGIVGFGLQLVGLALLAITLDLLTAMAVLIAPAVATNVWQVLGGGHARELLTRFWPFLLAVTVMVFVGALALTRVELPWLGALLGLVLVAYSLAGLVGVRFHVSERGERWLAPVVGAANGLITGMTGASVVPGTLYLQSLDLGRDRLVQAMGMLYLVSAAALALALHANGLLGSQLGALSLLAVVPALAGLYAGEKIRRRLHEALFRRLFNFALLALGLHLLWSLPI